MRLDALDVDGREVADTQMDSKLLLVLVVESQAKATQNILGMVLQPVDHLLEYSLLLSAWLHSHNLVVVKGYFDVTGEGPKHEEVFEEGLLFEFVKCDQHLVQSVRFVYALGFSLYEVIMPFIQKEVPF